MSLAALRARAAQWAAPRALSPAPLAPPPAPRVVVELRPVVAPGLAGLRTGHDRWRLPSLFSVDPSRPYGAPGARADAPLQTAATVPTPPSAPQSIGPLHAVGQAPAAPRVRPGSVVKRVSGAVGAAPTLGVRRGLRSLLHAGAGAEENVAAGVATTGRGVVMPGHVGAAIGALRERRVLRMLLDPKWHPAWLLGARLAMREEDLAGIDLVVDVADIGEPGTLYVQVKSSRDAVYDWKRKYGGTEVARRTVVVLFQPEAEEETEEALHTDLSDLYQRFHDRRGPITLARAE